eukprot:gene6968-4932_t
MAPTGRTIYSMIAPPISLSILTHVNGMAVPLPTREDTDVLRGYLQKLKSQEKYFEFGINVFIVNDQEIEDVVRSCNEMILELDRVSRFFLSKRDDQSGRKRKEPPRPQCSSLDESSAEEMIRSCNINSFLVPAMDELHKISDTLKKEREALQNFNQRHGYIWTADFPLLKKGQKELAIPFKAFEGIARESEELSSITNAILALEVADMPSVSVKKAYGTFICGATAVIDWVSSFVSVQNHEGEVPQSGPVADGSNTNTNAQRVRTVRLFQVHDTHQIYTLLLDGSRDWFHEWYQLYDPRFQGYGLKVHYVGSFREHVEDFYYEIQRLESVRARDASILTERMYPAYAFNPGSNFFSPPQREPGNALPRRGSQDLPTIVFNPSIHQLYFLYRTIQLYLSVSIHVEMLSSTHYFEETFKILEKSSRSVVEKLESLPQHPRRSGEPSVEPQGSADPGTNATEGSQVQLVLQLYRDVRSKVHSAIKNLEADILIGRSVLFTIDPTSVTSLETHLEIRVLEAELREKKTVQEPKSWWEKAKGAWNGITGLMTCQAEYNPAGAAAGLSSARQSSSTCVRQKEHILRQLNHIKDTLEEEGVLLERICPGFFRGRKERLLQHLDSVVGKAEKYSVLFGAPTPGTSNNSAPRRPEKQEKRGQVRTGIYMRLTLVLTHGGGGLFRRTPCFSHPAKSLSFSFNRQRRGVGQYRQVDHLLYLLYDGSSKQSATSLHQGGGNPIDMDIVFIHGFGSSPLRAWRDSKGVLWPAVYIPQDFPNCRVWSVGYDTDHMAVKPAHQNDPAAKGGASEQAGGDPLPGSDAQHHPRGVSRLGEVALVSGPGVELLYPTARWFSPTVEKTVKSLLGAAPASQGKQAPHPPPPPPPPPSGAEEKMQNAAADGTGFLPSWVPTGLGVVNPFGGYWGSTDKAKGAEQRTDSKNDHSPRPGRCRGSKPRPPPPPPPPSGAEEKMQNAAADGTGFLPSWVPTGLGVVNPFGGYWGPQTRPKERSSAPTAKTTTAGALQGKQAPHPPPPPPPPPSGAEEKMQNAAADGTGFLPSWVPTGLGVVNPFGGYWGSTDKAKGAEQRTDSKNDHSGAGAAASSPPAFQPARPQAGALQGKQAPHPPPPPPPSGAEEKMQNAAADGTGFLPSWVPTGLGVVNPFGGYWGPQTRPKERSSAPTAKTTTAGALQGKQAPHPPPPPPPPPSGAEEKMQNAAADGTGFLPSWVPTGLGVVNPFGGYWGPQTRPKERSSAPTAKTTTVGQEQQPVPPRPSSQRGPRPGRCRGSKPRTPPPPPPSGAEEKMQNAAADGTGFLPSWVPTGLGVVNPFGAIGGPQTRPKERSSAPTAKTTTAGALQGKQAPHPPPPPPPSGAEEKMQNAAADGTGFLPSWVPTGLGVVNPFGGYGGPQTRPKERSSAPTAKTTTAPGRGAAGKQAPHPPPPPPSGAEEKMQNAAADGTGFLPSWVPTGLGVVNPFGGYWGSTDKAKGAEQRTDSKNDHSGAGAAASSPPAFQPARPQAGALQGKTTEEEAPRWLYVSAAECATYPVPYLRCIARDVWARLQQAGVGRWAPGGAVEEGGLDTTSSLPVPIVFVCHSMGGLVVKALMVALKEEAEGRGGGSAETQEEKETTEECGGPSVVGPSNQAQGDARMALDAIAGVVFFATPHFGSPLATLVAGSLHSYLPSGIISPVLVELREGSAGTGTGEASGARLAADKGHPLRWLNERFLELTGEEEGAAGAPPQRRVHLLSLGETEKVHGVTTVVPPASANLFGLGCATQEEEEEEERHSRFPRFHLLRQTHHTIHRPETKNSAAYHLLYRFLANVRKNIRTRREVGEREGATFSAKEDLINKKREMDYRGIAILSPTSVCLLPTPSGGRLSSSIVCYYSSILPQQTKVKPKRKKKKKKKKKKKGSDAFSNGWTRDDAPRVAIPPLLGAHASSAGSLLLLVVVVVVFTPAFMRSISLLREEERTARVVRVCCLPCSSDTALQGAAAGIEVKVDLDGTVGSLYAAVRRGLGEDNGAALPLQLFVVPRTPGAEGRRLELVPVPGGEAPLAILATALGREADDPALMVYFTQDAEVVFGSADPTTTGCTFPPAQGGEEDRWWDEGNRSITGCGWNGALPGFNCSCDSTGTTPLPSHGTTLSATTFGIVVGVMGFGLLVGLVVLLCRCCSSLARKEKRRRALKRELKLEEEKIREALKHQSNLLYVDAVTSLPNEPTYNSNAEPPVVASYTAASSSIYPCPYYSQPPSRWGEGARWRFRWVMAQLLASGRKRKRREEKRSEAPRENCGGRFHPASQGDREAVVRQFSSLFCFLYRILASSSVWLGYIYIYTRGGGVRETSGSSQSKISKNMKLDLLANAFPLFWFCFLWVWKKEMAEPISFGIACKMKNGRREGKRKTVEGRMALLPSNQPLAKSFTFAFLLTRLRRCPYYKMDSPPFHKLAPLCFTFSSIGMCGFSLVWMGKLRTKVPTTLFFSRRSTLTLNPKPEINTSININKYIFTLLDLCFKTACFKFIPPRQSILGNSSFQLLFTKNVASALKIIYIIVFDLISIAGYTPLPLRFLRLKSRVEEASLDKTICWALHTTTCTSFCFVLVFVFLFRRGLCVVSRSIGEKGFHYYYYFNFILDPITTATVFFFRYYYYLFIYLFIYFFSLSLELKASFCIVPLHFAKAEPLKAVRTHSPTNYGLVCSRRKKRGKKSKNNIYIYIYIYI